MEDDKIITTVGFQIPGLSDNYLGFDSKKSLMDSDIIVMRPTLPDYQTSSVADGYYLGKICYGETGSFNLKDDLRHWKKELLNALKAGKTVFIFLSDKEDFYADTGVRSYSGSGRNRSTTINVAPGNNYEFLPVDVGTIIASSGKVIMVTGGAIFQAFYDDFKTDLEYKLYLENTPQMKAIFTGKDKTKILGSIITIDEGKLVLLPDLYYDEEEFTTYVKDKNGEDKGQWTPEAMKLGSKLISHIRAMDKEVNSLDSKTTPPAWVSSEQFMLKEEAEINLEIDKNNVAMDELTQKNKKLQDQLQEKTLLKDLLFEQGKPLEKAVIEALKILGFKAENYNDGDLELDQIIIGPENTRCIGECEGKDKKDINIDKLRQLMESMNADSFRDDVEEKALGILFGNAERLTEPEKRTLDFTEKCKKTAAREKIALIKTTDLFSVAKYLVESNDEEFRKACREAIYKGFGKIIEFPQVSTLIKSLKEDEKE